MQVTVTLPGTQNISQTKQAQRSYESLLSWIVDHDDTIAQELIHLQQMKYALKNKEYTISSSL